MEDLVITHRAHRAPLLDVRGVHVLVTGHTGFKGAWLCEWLLQAGAKVSGLALPPETPNGLFSILNLEERVNHAICDIRDPVALAAAVRQAKPQLIIHLAAQALVRRSYREPVLTWQTNVIGTLNLLEAARAMARPVTIVVVTTDKVYRNREWEYSYREEDELGGHDPYSASKASCELAVASWRLSFARDSEVTVVTGRAGNVLGAGDYSEDRIVPDCFRAWKLGEVVQLRSPSSTRPWQHVLEPLAGYLALAARARMGPMDFSTCNFGPGPEGDRSVEALVRQLAALGPDRRWSVCESAKLHEARALSLSIERACHKLGWAPRLTFEETLSWTNAGYNAAAAELSTIVRQQIAEFEARSPVFAR